MKKSILLVVAYFKVYGTSLYGSKHLGLDQGKDNLESYFCRHLGWSKVKLKKVIQIML